MPRKHDEDDDERSPDRGRRSESPRNDASTSAAAGKKRSYTPSPKRSRSRSGSRRRTRTRSRSHHRSRSRSRGRDYDSQDPNGIDFGNDEEGWRLHVADLDANATKRDLEKAFGKFGPLKEIWMARSVPCFAFIVYRYREDAEEAMKGTAGLEINDRRIRVTYARPRTRGQGGRGFDPNMKCYQCGYRGHFSRDCPEVSKYGYKRPVSPRRDGQYQHRGGGGYHHGGGGGGGYYRGGGGGGGGGYYRGGGGGSSRSYYGGGGDGYYEGGGRSGGGGDYYYRGGGGGGGYKDYGYKERSYHRY
jgi:arginine/serine-rich splicing factor 7